MPPTLIQRYLAFLALGFQPLVKENGALLLRAKAAWVLASVESHIFVLELVASTKPKERRQFWKSAQLQEQQAESSLVVKTL